MINVHVCNYGIGNIHNVLRALDHVGAAPIDCTSPDQLRNVERLVLPGVGAFSACMAAFTRSQFKEPVMEIIDKGIDVLAICVGMQMLADVSEEFGTHQGLGVIKGRVRRLSHTAEDGSRLAIPHIKWSELIDPGNKWIGTPLESLSPGVSAYFIHSYFFDCNDDEHQLATFLYGGKSYTAAVRKERVIGTQFHPEKSGKPGLQMLTSFVKGQDINDDKY